MSQTNYNSIEISICEAMVYEELGWEDAIRELKKRGYHYADTQKFRYYYLALYERLRG